MYNIKTGAALAAEWGLTTEDYNKGGFGNITGQFKLYRSLLTAWTMDDPNHVVDPDDPLAAIPQVIDIEKAYQEIALQYVEALYGTFEVLRVLGFAGLFPGVQERLRNGVKQAVQLAIYNRNVLEKVSSLSRSGGSIQITDGQSSEIIPIDMFGLKGATTIINSGIMGYDIIDTKEEAQMLSENGNLIIGKFDETKIPDLN